MTPQRDAASGGRKGAKCRRKEKSAPADPTGPAPDDVDDDVDHKLAGPAFGVRLKQLRVMMFGKRGQKDFAVFVDIPQSSLGKYERGVTPNLDALCRIVNASNVNANWLLCGDGRMFRDAAEPDPDGNPTLECVGVVPADGMAWDKREATRIPAVLPYTSARNLAAIVGGDALIPDFRDGDVLIFERFESAHPRDDWPARIEFGIRQINQRLCLVQVSNVAVIRYAQVNPEQRHAVLVAPNPRYAPQVVSFDLDQRDTIWVGDTRIEDWNVVGMLVSVLRTDKR